MKKTILRSAVLGGVLGLAAGFVVMATVMATVLAAPSTPENAEVKIDNFTFAPQSLTIKAGTTVTWANEDDIPHTVASTSKAFKSKVLDTDDKFSFTFTSAGTYEYFCSLHPHMTGTIVVESATGGGAAP
jgi:amicyanin